MEADLKKSIIAGLLRHYSEDVRYWSYKSIEGLISPLGSSNSLLSPNIQAIFKELENEGFIKLHLQDEKYLEVLEKKVK